MRETAAIFEAVTQPFVASLPAQQLSWVWNVLEKKKEAELIIDESDDYLLVPDSKWDRTDTTSLHCLAIAKDRSLHSLRDLRGSHAPMLKVHPHPHPHPEPSPGALTLSPHSHPHPHPHPHRTC